MRIARGAAMVALLAGAVLVVYVLLAGGDGGHSYKLLFENGGQLVRGNEVLVGGQPDRHGRRSRPDRRRRGGGGDHRRRAPARGDDGGDPLHLPVRRRQPLRLDSPGPRLRPGDRLRLHARRPTTPPRLWISTSSSPRSTEEHPREPAGRDRGLGRAVRRQQRGGAGDLQVPGAVAAGHPAAAGRAQPRLEDLRRVPGQRRRRARDRRRAARRPLRADPERERGARGDRGRERCPRPLPVGAPAGDAPGQHHLRRTSARRSTTSTRSSPRPSARPRSCPASCATSARSLERAVPVVGDLRLASRGPGPTTT